MDTRANGRAAGPTLAPPPMFRQAEQATLGTVMLSSQQAARLLPVLRAEHFADPRHADVLRALQTLYAAGQPVDPVTAHGQLRRDGQLRWGETDAGLLLVACLEAAHTPSVGAAYAALVLEYAARRRIVEAGQRLTQAGQHGRGSTADLRRLLDTEFAAARSVLDTAERIGRCVDGPPARVPNHPQRRQDEPGIGGRP